MYPNRQFFTEFRNLITIKNFQGFEFQNLKYSMDVINSKVTIVNSKSSLSPFI